MCKLMVVGGVSSRDGIEATVQETAHLQHAHTHGQRHSLGEEWEGQEEGRGGGRESVVPLSS